MLSLPGPDFAFKYDGDFKVSGVPIFIEQEGGKGRGTAWCVWDGAAVLARYIDLCGSAMLGQNSRHTHDLRPEQSRPTYCIELGSGTGLGGLSVAQIFQVPVALTDIAEAMSALKTNVNLNPRLKHLAAPMVLDWTAPDVPSVVRQLQDMCAPELNAPRRLVSDRSGDNIAQEDSTSLHASMCVHRISTADTNVQQRANMHQRSSGATSIIGVVLVLASDCVWVQHLVEPFVTTLQQVCSACERAVVLLAHKRRSTYVDRVLLDRLKQAFEIELMPLLPGEWRGSIEILKLLPVV